MKEFFATTGLMKNLDLSHFLSKEKDMVSLLHDRKLSETFQSFLCNIYLFCHNQTTTAGIINLERISALYQQAVDLMMNSPEFKALLSDFRISDWIKDVLAMLDILKTAKLYVPEDERIQTCRDIRLHFSTEEGLYYDKLLRQFQESAQQVGPTNIKGYTFELI